MKLALVVLSPGKWEGKRIAVGLPRFVIGRDPGCHLRASSASISKRHCELVVREGSVSIQDLNSRNGTFVNKQRIQEAIELHSGDWMQIGPLAFRVEIETSSSTDEVPAASPQGTGEEPDAGLLVPWEDSAASEPLTRGDEDPGETATEGRPAPVVRSEKPEPAAEKRKAQPTWMQVKPAGTATVVQFSIRAILDDATIQSIGRQLTEIVDQMGVPNIVLNFTGVNYLSSSMIGKVLAAQKKAKAGGGSLALCSVCPEVRQIFELTSLTKILTIYEDENAALRDM